MKHYNVSNSFQVSVLLFAIFLTGCDDKSIWKERQIPTTEAEVAAVTAHVQKIIPNVPTNVSGSDQDWEDAIEAAHIQARISICRPTLWEWKDYEYTGRWRYSEEAK